MRIKVNDAIQLIQNSPGPHCPNKCGRTATTGCFDCKIPLCEECFTLIHNNPVFSRHTRVSLLEGLRYQYKCFTHKQPLDSFCPKHSSLTCCECVAMGGHRNCDTVLLEDYIEKTKNDLKSISVVLSKRAEEVISAKETVKTTIQSVVDQHEHCMSQVKEVFMQLFSAVQSRKDELLEKLVNIKEERTYSLREQEAALHATSERFKKCSQVAEKAAEDGSVSAITRGGRVASSALRDSLILPDNISLQPWVSPDLKLFFNSSEVVEMVKIFGNLSIGTNPKLSSPENLRLVMRTPNSITLTWDPPSSSLELGGDFQSDDFNNDEICWEDENEEASPKPKAIYKVYLVVSHHHSRESIGSKSSGHQRSTSYNLLTLNEPHQATAKTPVEEKIVEDPAIKIVNATEFVPRHARSVPSLGKAQISKSDEAFRLPHSSLPSTANSSNSTSTSTSTLNSTSSLASAQILPKRSKPATPIPGESKYIEVYCGSQRTCIVTGLAPASPYFFSVSCFSSKASLGNYGAESDRSEPVLLETQQLSKWHDLPPGITLDEADGSLRKTGANGWGICISTEVISSGQKYVEIEVVSNPRTLGLMFGVVAASDVKAVPGFHFESRSNVIGFAWNSNNANLFGTVPQTRVITLAEHPFAKGSKIGMNIDIDAKSLQYYFCGQKVGQAVPLSSLFDLQCQAKPDLEPGVKLAIAMHFDGQIVRVLEDADPSAGASLMSQTTSSISVPPPMGLLPLPANSGAAPSPDRNQSLSVSSPNNVNSPLLTSPILGTSNMNSNGGLTSSAPVPTTGFPPYVMPLQGSMMSPPAGIHAPSFSPSGSRVLQGAIGSGPKVKSPVFNRTYL
eukprot:TRINITY_DN17465_c0_g1_i1.p1 TRINITY_DN17465_c0_g1~~TRINITY_DN17465_c0_g1_i1.p1  ORF type:complete len:942 (+),score=208.32 TRINITY_DN17465_c0_g1_i1:288-2828(+)